MTAPVPPLLRAYEALLTLAGPALTLHLRARARAGKENPARLGERRGAARLPRPAGPILWVHAASVGESLSVLALLAGLRSLHPEVVPLVTTGTRTSAGLLAERLPAGALQQMAPLDRPAWVAAFLDHWRPAGALWVESEVWPATLRALDRRRIPRALVQGRISPRSAGRWRRLARASAASLLAPFAPCLAQSEGDRDRLASLGAIAPRAVGNLKLAADPLPADPQSLAAATHWARGRPVVVWASTHPGEEARALAAHRNLPRGCLTLLVPRHPTRGPEVAALARAAGLPTARRGEGATPDPATEVYVADTLGELGLWYRLASLAVLGGGWSTLGGHNPVEPARLGCPPVLGPRQRAFAEVAAEMAAAGACHKLDEGASIGPTLASLMAEPDRTAFAARARAWAESHGAVLGRVLAELQPFLARVAAGAGV